MLYETRGDREFAESVKHSLAQIAMELKRMNDREEARAEAGAKKEEQDRARDILAAYVTNDYDVTGDRDYVQMALAAAGCSEEEAEKFGLGWIYQEE